MTHFPKVGQTVTLPSGRRAIVKRVQDDAIQLDYLDAEDGERGEVHISRLFFMRYL